MKEIIFKAEWYSLDLTVYRKSTALTTVSVHDSVINLSAEGWCHLLFLAAPHSWRGPATIGLDEESFGTILSRLQPGDTGFYRPGELGFGAGGIAFRINFNESASLSFVPPDGLILEAERLHPALSELSRKIAGVSESASSVLVGGNAGEDFFRRRIAEHFPALVSSLQAGDESLFQSSCLELAGLGRGSTPTGDDLIYGALITFCYYHKATGQPWQAPVFPSRLFATTTSLGAHMLEQGRRGLAPSPVIGLLTGLFQGQLKKETLQNICLLGASTGYDISAAVAFTLEELIG